MIPRRWAHTEPGELHDIAAWAESDLARDEALVAEFERAVAGHLGVPHAAAVNSGRRGMTLIFEHLGLGAGDEVIVPAYTLGALIPLIQGFGAAAVPADVDPDTFNVPVDAVERRLSSRTKAILALHAFGAPCDVEAMVALGRQHKIPVIEDCAHSLGATFQGRQTGSFGYAAFFSFETAKPVNTFGGGMVVSQDQALIEHVRRHTASDAPDLGSVMQKVKAVRTEQRLFSTGLAYPLLYLLATPGLKGLMNRLYRAVGQHAPPCDVRYSPVQAKLGLKKLPRLNERIARRKARADLMGSLLGPGIRPQRLLDGAESTWYVFVATLPCEAAPIRKKLLLKGIDAGVGEEIADNTAALLGYADCPNIARLHPRAMSLPMYDGVSEEAVAKVARALNALVS